MLTVKHIFIRITAILRPEFPIVNYYLLNLHLSFSSSILEKKDETSMTREIGKSLQENNLKLGRFKHVLLEVILISKTETF